MQCRLTKEQAKRLDEAVYYVTDETSSVSDYYTQSWIRVPVDHTAIDLMEALERKMSDAYFTKYSNNRKGWTVELLEIKSNKTILPIIKHKELVVALCNFLIKHEPLFLKQQDIDFKKYWAKRREEEK